MEIFGKTKINFFISPQVWAWNEKRIKYFNNPLIKIILKSSRETLYKNCDIRFDKMIKNGAIEEVELLIKKKLPKKQKPKPIFPFTKLKGEKGAKFRQKIYNDKTDKYGIYGHYIEDLLLKGMKFNYISNILTLNIIN